METTVATLDDGAYTPGFLNCKENIAALHAISLQPRGELSPSRLKQLDDMIIKGSVVHNHAHTTGQRSDIDQAREAFVAYTGLLDPSHDLHLAYKGVLRNRPKGLRPVQLLGLVRGLTDICGDAASGLKVIQDAPNLLVNSRENVLLRYRYYERAAHAIQWRGDVRKTVRGHGRLFIAAGPLKVLVLGKLAGRYGTPEQRDLPEWKMAAIIKAPLEVNLLACLKKGSDYLPGDSITSRGLARNRENLYTQLGNPKAVQQLGPDIVRLYLRQAPPTMSALRKFPYLAELVNPGRLEGENTATLGARNTIKGGESWLSITAVRRAKGRRTEWLHRANELARIGSESIDRLSPGNRDYDEIVDARFGFFKHMGWCDNKHTRDSFERFANTYAGLVSPQRLIDLFGLLHQYGVKVRIGHIRSCLTLCKYASSTTRYKLEAIVDKGLDAETLLSQSVRLLTLPFDKFHRNLARRS